jgi:hypothetical protein
VSIRDLDQLAQEPAQAAKREWVLLGYRHYGLKNGTGRLLAEVRGTWPHDVWEVGGQRYHGLDAAKAAAERGAA